MTDPPRISWVTIAVYAFIAAACIGFWAAAWHWFIHPIGDAILNG